jgi:hypothetical protein
MPSYDSDWVKYRAGEAKRPYSPFADEVDLDKGITTQAMSLAKRIGEAPPSKNVSALAKWLRIPRMMQGK